MPAPQSGVEYDLRLHAVPTVGRIAHARPRVDAVSS